MVMAEADDNPVAKPDTETATETKTVPETETMAISTDIAGDVKSGLLERLQFFFSNANIRQDNFMRGFLIRQEGVPVDALLRFNTINKYTKDCEVLLQVAREIEDLKVAENGKTIHRKVPFTWNNMKEHIPLSLYVSNISVTNQKYDVTTDEFKQLFVNFPGLTLVKLCMKQIFPEGERTKGSKPLKVIAHGSALVEFDTVEHLQEAADQLLTIKDGIEVEPKVKLELKGRTLTVKTLHEHDDKKSKGKHAKDKEKAEAEANGKSDEKADEKFKAGEKRKPKKEEPSIEPYVFDWKPECVIKMDELAPTCDREKIMEAVCEALGIPLEAVKGKNLYVDYSRGQKEGAIRWDQPNEKEIGLVLQKLVSGDVLVAGGKVKAKVLEGDAEKEYWDKFIDFKTKQLQQRAQERGGRKRRKR